MARIEIVGPKGSRVISRCLVDTGADYLQVPQSALNGLGISLQTATPVTVSAAGNTRVSMSKLTGVDVIIEGKRVTVDILLAPGTSTPVLGRQALLAAFDVGFDTSAWLRR